jgi:N-acetylglucosaminyldiphosphoundecaprenol N-acetyl-beta-D-mannosaminyltransferase
VTQTNPVPAARDAPVPAAGPAPSDFINLLGVRVSAVNVPMTVELIDTAISAGQGGYICVTGAHGIIECQRDQSLRSIHNSAYLVTPDGMPLVWALKRSGHAEADRVYGPDLMLATVDAGRSRGRRHFLYGSTPETLQRLRTNLVARYPGAEIVGEFSPPFRALTAGEEIEIARLIRESSAEIVWVGLSTPKQEMWISRMRASLAPAILIGVGAAFDFHAGVKVQAPRFIQRSGFEWLFRLALEPRRLWRRYLVTVPSFIVLSIAQYAKLRTFALDGADGPEKPAGGATANS